MMTGEKLTIGKLEAIDIPQVMQIERESFRWPWPENMFIQEEGLGFSHVLVAKLDEPNDLEVAGYIVYWLFSAELHIHNLAVKKELRQTGVGAALIREAFNHARKEAAQRAFLEVRCGNEAAIGLYRKNGFQLVGRRKGYYGETGEDALVMARLL